MIGSGRSFFDGDKLSPTYDEWLKGAEKGVEMMSRRPGLMVVKVEITPDEFLAWCERKGLRPNSMVRQEFGAERARDAYLESTERGRR